MFAIYLFSFQLTPVCRQRFDEIILPTISLNIATVVVVMKRIKLHISAMCHVMWQARIMCHVIWIAKIMCHVMWIAKIMCHVK